jgi:hypothetical protein
MTTLPAGSFRVSDYRKPIPRRVELAVLIRQECKDPAGVPFKQDDAIQFDHRPPLESRPYDTEAGDFIPPQHDSAHIDAQRKGKHLEKTTGRKEGAERTVTTRGSDAGNRKLDRKVRHAQAVHNYKLAVKVHGQTEAARQYPEVARLIARRARRIENRGFVKGHRPLRSRNDLRRPTA